MIRPHLPLALGALIVAVAPSLAVATGDMASIPNSILTPGAIDPAATADIVCNRTTKERRSVTSAMKAEVLAAYDIPESESAYYEIDHLIPLAIGGANAVTNLWPQPWVEADAKDVLEVELQRRVCHGLITQAAAQRAIADDWVSAYERYVGGTPTAVSSAPQVSVAPAKPSATTRIKRDLQRLAWGWLFGRN